jgi:hypothetical protein
VAFVSTVMVLCMLVTINKTKCMGKACLNGPTVENTRAIGLMINYMVKGHLHGQMVASTVVSINRI